MVFGEFKKVKSAGSRLWGAITCLSRIFYLKCWGRTVLKGMRTGSDPLVSVGGRTHAEVIGSGGVRGSDLEILWEPFLSSRV